MAKNKKISFGLYVHEVCEYLETHHLWPYPMLTMSVEKDRQGKHLNVIFANYNNNISPEDTAIELETGYTPQMVQAASKVLGYSVDPEELDGVWCLIDKPIKELRSELRKAQRERKHAVGTKANLAGFPSCEVESLQIAIALKPLIEKRRKSEITLHR